MAAETCRGAGVPAFLPWLEQPLAKSSAASLRHGRQHRRAAFYPLPRLHADNRINRKNNVGSRSKLDETHALPTLHSIALAIVEYDASSDQTGNLLEHDLNTFSPYRHNVLLIALRTSWIHGIEIEAFLIANACDHAADWRAIHMHIEDVQENTDSLPGPLGSVDRNGLRDQAVCRRNDQSFARRNRALRIAKE